MLLINQIQSVTERHIFYINETGEETTIELMACYQNYLLEHLTEAAWARHKERNGEHAFPWDVYLQRAIRWREVGRSQPLSPPWGEGPHPYIEFHTTPVTRFYRPDNMPENRQNLFARLVDAGWQMYDLS
jgi:hypothetical protein